mmetsp:Transcript_133907/g.199125  ORF Transcript_133907/g.199125 Transcript_133907/m.199125 type:complete len:991 (+) Transcript_133907:69-3041(+)
MGKKNTKRAKRSLGSAPKGLIRKGKESDPGNPFELTARQKRPKHLVHNRPLPKPKSTKHALESLRRRQTQLRTSLSSTKKVNVFVDRRIGQYDSSMTHEDQMLARLVKERSRQSRKTSKFQLDDDNQDGDNNFLTHKGKKLDPNKSETIYSDDEDDYGNLEAVDTELHFGGSGMTSQETTAYGGSSATGLAQVYSQRKTELDDLITRRKHIKAERMQARETQVETVEKMDEDFAELSQLLRYRKNEKRPLIPPKPTEEDKEMNEWNLEMKKMMMRPKKAATDRTKTPEEIAKEEAERLHELETRRMARMNGDFEEDDFSDISVDDYRNKNKKNKPIKKKSEHRNPDELSDSDDEQEDEHEVRFTADGLQKFDKDGRVVEMEENDDDDDSDSEGGEDESDDEDEVAHPIAIGTRVRGNYRIAEQFGAQDAWYEGTVKKAHEEPDGSYKYDVEYDDGDFEEDMLPENVKPINKTLEEKSKDREQTEKGLEAKFKRSKARDKARNEIPFVFEVPTTLEALHEMIARYATTGRDASTIIQRIHKANSVRLDRRNSEKMQNFYDVLLRRFIAVGDAIFESGDGGEELGRYEQLDCLVRVMYTMAHDAPESAGAVWSRRLGIFQNAHAKRLRDAEFLHEEDNDDEDTLVTAWPSTGTFLLLRAMGHIFPVTDRRHYVVTPTLLLLGQIVAQTPITCAYDIVMGTLCSGLLIEYSRGAKRVVPEAMGFLGGVIRLFSPNPDRFALPTFESAYNLPEIKLLRQQVKAVVKDQIPSLELAREFVRASEPDVAIAALGASLQTIERCTENLDGSFALDAESELLSDVSDCILSLRPNQFPEALQKQLKLTASAVARVCTSTRLPLRRRTGAGAAKSAVKSLAPRMEDPAKYSMSKDKGKKAVQAALDRTRREYKREHKAISRELRLDGAFIEKERRAEREKKDEKARAKRQKNFAWLEGEQASMNQQVRLGGGLLKGGGTGAARAKAASAKLGIKKGGKF